MINLCLVVIATQFSETKKRETERMAVERARRRHGRQSRSSSSVTSRTSVVGGGPAAGGCYDELLTLVGYLVRLAQRRAARLLARLGRRRRLRRRRGRPIPAELTPVYTVTRPPRRRRRSGGRPAGARRRPGRAPYASPELSDVDLTASPRRPTNPSTTTTTAAGELCTAAAAAAPPTDPRQLCPGNFYASSQYAYLLAY